MNPARIRTVSQGAGKSISQTRQAHRRLPFYVNAAESGNFRAGPIRLDTSPHITVIVFTITVKYPQ